MLISDSTSTVRALGDIEARERDVLQAYSPGALPERPGVARDAPASFTIDPLSVAAPADAYFVTRAEDGRELFTRDGSFAIRDGALVDDSGRPVLGYAGERATLHPLRADAVDVALGFAGGAQIDADGVLAYERATVDPRTGQRQVQRTTIGRIALARFPAGTKLQAVDAQHGSAPAGVLPHIGRAADGNFGVITPFARAASGIDIDLGLQRLADAYLALDAIRAASKAQAGAEKTAMDLLK